MAAEASKPSGGSADSYIGSLISLTSKCEIRYEGVLFNINTEESSIGLRNVRSFGTEGRKKDGKQIPPSDKVYDYILFRGRDIKDLQVKASPPAQMMPPIHNDPAIIQSHYLRPASVSASQPSVGSGTAANDNLNTTQLGPPGPIPLYQAAGNLGPGGNTGSWGSSPAPPTGNASGLPVPMYWQGIYGPSSGLPHLQQQPLLRPGGPPPGLSIPPPMQHPLQYPNVNSSLPIEAPNLPEFPSSMPPVSSNLNPSSLALPSTVPPAQPAASGSETAPSLANKTPTTSLLVATSSSNMPLMSPLTTSCLDINSSIAPIFNKPQAASGPILSDPSMSHSITDVGGPSTSSHIEASLPPLVTPGQLLQPRPANFSSQLQQIGKEIVDVQMAASESSVPPLADSKAAPILPLPTLNDRKVNGPLPQICHNNFRGREKGRGNGASRAITRFTEDFDFLAMNEKFKKDEVWGDLGKSRSQLKHEVAIEEADDFDDEDVGSSKSEITPVYSKDDFFDSLSCNALDRGSRNGRTKFLEQRKIDTETFGDFSRYRGRGGYGLGRGGRSRGGYYGRGYGYVGRGRG